MEFSASNIKTVELELTSRCNAQCAVCGRFDFTNTYQIVREEARVNAELPMADLSVDDIGQILPERFLKTIEAIVLCGSHGDAIMVDDLHKTLDYLTTANPDLALQFNTNGGARSKAWWTALAQFFNREDRHVVFAIDGFEDTHHLHRGNTRFEKVIENARTFIAAGGRAKWKFVIFRHNQHEIDKARSLADEMGFIEFIPIYSFRFANDTGEGMPVLSKGKRSHFLQRSQRVVPNAFNGGERCLSARTNPDHSILTTVDCEAIKQGYLYIDFLGRVWPCSFTARSALYRDFWAPLPSQVTVGNLLEDYPPDILDGRKHPIEEIIEGEFFSHLRTMMHAPHGLPVCMRYCGK